MGTVDVAFLVEGEVLTRRCRPHAWSNPNEDVWRDPLLANDPIERRRRAVGGIGHKPLGLDFEAFLGALDHLFGRAHFGLADRAGASTSMMLGL